MASAKHNPRDQSARDLAGTTRTTLSPSRALRARDLNQPDEDDLAAAERDVVLVRRNWHPPAD